MSKVPARQIWFCPCSLRVWFCPCSLRRSDDGQRAGTASPPMSSVSLTFGCLCDESIGLLSGVDEDQDSVAFLWPLMDVFDSSVELQGSTGRISGFCSLLSDSPNLHEAIRVHLKGHT